MARTPVDEIIIRVNEVGTTVTEISGKIEQTRSVSPEDLKTIFSKEAFDTEDLCGGLIPCSGTGLIFAGRKGDFEAIVMQSDARRTGINWGRVQADGSNRIENVPFPHLVFAFQLRGKVDTRRRTNRLKNLKIFALERAWRTPHDPVFKFTGYGNTYDNGDICWGTNRLFVNDISDVRGIMNAFYTTSFNHHVNGQQSFVEQCAEAGEYPLEGRRLSKSLQDVVKETYRGETY